jgi:phosphotransferase system HPr (HPr) family protein
MIKKEAKVKSRYGIHARPSMAIAVASKNFPDTSIRIINPENNQESDAKSIIELMMMALSCNDKVIVCASGKDEEKALETIASIIESYEVETK